MDLQIKEDGQFQFSEVCSLTGVKPYVLRFWENEFEQIQPSLNENGEKIYNSQHLHFVGWIKKLLFEDKLSITQAKLKIGQEWRGEESGELMDDLLKEETPGVFFDDERLAKIEEAKNILHEVIKMSEEGINSRPSSL